MATLTDNISADEERFVVSGDVTAAVTKVGYRIDDEIVLLRAFGQTDPWSPRYGTDRARWVVARGAEGTTPATHLAGATIVAVEEAVTSSTTLVPPEPFAGEGGPGGGVTVDNTVDTPAAVTTIVAPGAVIVGDTATMPYLISIASTGADDAEIALLATAEDGSVDITLNAFSDTSPGTMLLSAGSGDTGANIQFLASNGLGSEITLTATRIGFYGTLPTAQSAAIADATDPASTMANLNTLLAYLRLRGDIAT